MMRNLIDLFEATVQQQPRKPVTNLVFVYGSLKRGFGNHHVLGNSRFIGSGQTPPRFDLLDLHAFPAAIPGRKSVTGELYQVNAKVMRDLDRLEGNGFMYQREQIPVVVNGKQVLAWFYVYLDDDGYDDLVEPQGKIVTWKLPSRY